jgi:hypothetical protein
VGVAGVVEPREELNKVAWEQFEKAVFLAMQPNDKQSSVEQDPTKVVVPATFSAAQQIIDLSVLVMERVFGIKDVPVSSYREALSFVTGLFEIMSHILGDLMLDESGRDSIVIARLEKLGYKPILDGIRSDCGRATLDERLILALKSFGQYAVYIFCLLDKTKKQWPQLHQIDKKDGCFMHLDDLFAMMVAMVVNHVLEQERVVPKRAQMFANWLFRRQMKQMERQLSPQTAEKLRLSEPYMIAYLGQLTYSPNLEQYKSEKKYVSVMQREIVVYAIIIGLALDILLINNWIARTFWRFIGVKKLEVVRQTVMAMLSFVSETRLVIPITTTGEVAMTHLQAVKKEVRGHLAAYALYCNIIGLVAGGLAFDDLQKARIPVEELFPKASSDNN